MIGILVCVCVVNSIDSLKLMSILLDDLRLSRRKSIDIIEHDGDWLIGCTYLMM